MAKKEASKDKDLTKAQRKRKAEILRKEVQQVRVGKGMKAADLVDAMAGMSVQARNVGRCARVLDGMMRDKGRPTVLLGLAGPLIAAGLRNVIADLIGGGYVDVLVSTGAILYQDVYQSRGHRHFVGTPTADDVELRSLYIDRIYDTYVDEEKFIRTDEWCGRIADTMGPGAFSSRQYLAHLSAHIEDPSSILHQCRKKGVPVFCPAINDSSIGIGLTDHRHRCVLAGREGIRIDSIQDNYEIAQLVGKSKKTAAIYVAGGVPKNYINDAVVMGYFLGMEGGHSYALQVTTANPADGGLSGSTLGEAQSWGKIEAEAKFAMAWVEPSVALPLLAAYLFDRHPNPKRGRLVYDWDGQVLKSLKVAR